ncbi:hypothetical protein Q8A73_020111 [Channa argus]|nr:hypothetical protein Q8A73_020111 [Channa argus]
MEKVPGKSLVAQQDPIFSRSAEPASLVSADEDFPSHVAALSCVEQMDFLVGLEEIGYGQYVDLDRAEKAGLVNPPLLEPSLAPYLAPSQTNGVSGPVLLPIQTYQVMCLAELGVQGAQRNSLCALVKRTTDYILCMSHCAAVSFVSWETGDQLRTRRNVGQLGNSNRRDDSRLVGRPRDRFEVGQLGERTKARTGISQLGDRTRVSSELDAGTGADGTAKPEIHAETGNPEKDSGTDRTSTEHEART